MFKCKYDEKCNAINELTKARKEINKNLEQFCRTACVAIQNKWNIGFVWQDLEKAIKELK